MERSQIVRRLRNVARKTLPPIRGHSFLFTRMSNEIKSLFMGLNNEDRRIIVGLEYEKAVKTIAQTPDLQKFGYWDKCSYGR